jgi:hypothetical protein
VQAPLDGLGAPAANQKQRLLERLCLSAQHTAKDCVLCCPARGVFASCRLCHVTDQRVAAPDATCRRTLVTPHPSKANFIQPGRRPLSAMSPIIVTHRASGRLVAVAGASGGPLIVSATAQTLARWVAASVTVVAVYPLHASVHVLLLCGWCTCSYYAA